MDFYIRVKGDPNYDPTKIHSESELSQLLTQIETMLFTNKGEVLGEPEFGANLEDLVYSLGYNEGQIKDVINYQMLNYVPLASKYSTQTTVEFYKGNVRDIAQINITIDSKYQVGVYIN